MTHHDVTEGCRHVEKLFCLRWVNDASEARLHIFNITAFESAQHVQQGVEFILFNSQFSSRLGGAGQHGCLLFGLFKVDVGGDVGGFLQHIDADAVSFTNLSERVYILVGSKIFLIGVLEDTEDINLVWVFLHGASPSSPYRFSCSLSKSMASSDNVMPPMSLPVCLADSSSFSVSAASSIFLGF